MASPSTKSTMLWTGFSKFNVVKCTFLLLDKRYWTVGLGFGSDNISLANHPVRPGAYAIRAYQLVVESGAVAHDGNKDLENWIIGNCGIAYSNLLMVKAPQIPVVKTPIRKQK